MQNATVLTDGVTGGADQAPHRCSIAGERPVLTFKAQRLYIRANAGVPPANGIVNGLWRALFCQKEQMFSEAGTPADGFFRYGPDR